MVRWIGPMEGVERNALDEPWKKTNGTPPPPLTHMHHLATNGLKLLSLLPPCRVQRSPPSADQKEERWRIFCTMLPFSVRTFLYYMKNFIGYKFILLIGLPISFAISSILFFFFCSKNLENAPFPSCTMYLRSGKSNSIQKKKRIKDKRETK